MFETFVSLLLSLSISAQGVMFPFSFWKTAASSGGNSFITSFTCNGTLTTDGDYKVCDYTTSGTTTFVIGAGNASGTGALRRLVIAGGGGGGKGSGGGGGAGGLKELTSDYVPGTYTVTVGLGGAAGTVSTVPGTNGSNSIFDADTATGGGGGAGGNAASSVGNGGSGGGGSPGAPTPGTGIAGQGFAGGNGDAADGSPAGGGGCGSVGEDGTVTKYGDGGTGCNSDILVAGVFVCYAGGGTNAGDPAATATCGGGKNAGSPGTANTGGGGYGNVGVSVPGVGRQGRVALRWKFQ